MRRINRGGARGLVDGLCLGWGMGLALLATLAEPRLHAAELSIERSTVGGPLISATAKDDEVVQLESTADLKAWNEWLVGHGPLERIADLTGGPEGAGFYRARVRARVDADDWKNVIRGTDDPFRAETPQFPNPQPRWIKFALRLDEPERIYFQDSERYPFHYEFAVKRLPGFEGMTREAFDAVTLRTNGQQVVLGAVLFAPTPSANEMAIQFVGQDPYPREAVADWFHAVRARVMASEGMDAFYLPTFEQADVARANVAWFADQGIPVGSADRWVTGDECYAPGWTLGRLVFVPAAEIDEAYGDGRLGPEDVLLTDAIPADIPPIAGIISLAPATPNSHVAILARSLGIPFVYFANPGEAERLQAWVGRDVLLRSVELFLGCEAEVAVLASPLDSETRETILGIKRPPPLNIVAKQTKGQPSVPVDDLGPADIRYVGGKAANLGVLRRAIPDNSPSPAIALTFDLWDGFLQQPTPNGKSLGETVTERLADFEWPPNMADVLEALDDVRDMIRDDVDFSAAQKESILAILRDAGFDSLRKIRFRSSTNVEDSEVFSGAGLYDSFSGCLQDDLDTDTQGPSHCDPTENNERGVFRALRRVYASFYNDNAFLERLRHGVDETKVGMAVLVHYSTPDEIELANGVATLDVRRSDSDRAVDAQLVSQVGAVSVSNPDNDARPEVVTGTQFTTGMEPYFEVDRRSSLVPLGGNVLEWPGDYEALYDLLNTASLRWESERPGRLRWLLDFEYKKVAPSGALRVKQIRPLPISAEGSPTTDWLLNTTNRWGVLQGEFGNLLSLHRLKSFWTFQVRHTGVAATNLQQTLFTQVEGRWVDGDQERTVSGAITNLPGHRYRYSAPRTEDAWEETASTRFLRVDLDRYAMPGEGPLAILDDLRVEFAVQYSVAQSVAEFGLGGQITISMVKEEVVPLTPLTEVTSASKLQERSMGKGSQRIETSFYWPPDPKGIVAGYTAPLQAWVETTLTGFTSRPIALRGEFAQTYRPGHHNFWEEFLFDPWLEPGVDPDLLEELRADNVRAIIATRDSGGEFSFAIWGMDGTFRPLP